MRWRTAIRVAIVLIATALLAVVVAASCVDAPHSSFSIPYSPSLAPHFRLTPEAELLPGERQSNGWPSDDSLTAGVQRFCGDAMSREGWR